MTNKQIRVYYFILGMVFGGGVSGIIFHTIIMRLLDLVM